MPQWMLQLQRLEDQRSYWPCRVPQQKSAAVADTDIGIGGTCSWKMCSVTPAHTYAVFRNHQPRQL